HQARRPRRGRGVEVARRSRVVPPRDDLHGRDLQERGEDDVRQGCVAAGSVRPSPLQPGRQHQACDRFSLGRHHRREGVDGAHSRRGRPEFGLSRRSVHPRISCCTVAQHKVDARMRGHPLTSESVEEFRSRARAWLAANMPRLDPAKAALLERDQPPAWKRARELQKLLYDGGFAGICFPREYGGLGLSYEYKKAFDAESLSYETPLLLNVPSFGICCATILDTGSEEQKRAHIPAALRGEEVLVQLLSEPSGGSDLAGVITRADR